MNIRADVQRAQAMLADILLPVVRAALDAAAIAAHGLLAQYPPPRPGQRYRRTGNLRQKLIITKPNPDTVVVINTARYARWVYGPPQAWVHRGRWAHVNDAAAEARKAFIVTVREQLERRSR